MSTQIAVTKICQHCGQEFIAKTLVTRYCSHHCNRRQYKQMKRAEKIEAYHRKSAQTTDNDSPESRADLLNREFLSLDETARLLGASRRTIQRLVSDNRLKAGRVGRRVIIKRTEIDKLFK